MGLTQVTVAIRNPAEPERVWESLFLVDTGAIDSLAPRDALESIGLKAKGTRTYELADGGETQMDVTVAEIEFMGDLIGGTVVMGEPGTEPILGVTALESLGIEVDPRTQKLKRMPSIRLKKLRAVPSQNVQRAWRLAQSRGDAE